jgi:hypothetical protein
VSELEERRAHPRFPVSFPVRCRRLGPPRLQVTDEALVVDLSIGGMCIVAPTWIDVGNVVMIETEENAVRGLVVAVNDADPDTAERHAHIACSRLGVEAEVALGRLLEVHAEPQ